MALALAWIVLSAPGPALGGSSAAGTKGFSGINLGGSARLLAMGGAGTAGVREPAAIWVNPARLAGMQAPEMSFTHGVWLVDTTLEQFAGAYPTPLGILGGAFSIVRAGEIDEFDKNGVETGSFTPADSEFSGAYAVSLGSFAFGAVASYLRSELADDATAAAFAGGFGAGFAPHPALTVSAAVLHVGSSLKYDRKASSLPATLRGGVSYSLRSAGVSLAADAVKPGDGEIEFRGGAEEEFRVLDELSASVRCGWHSLAPGPGGGTTGISAGGGITWRPGRGLGDSERDISAVRVDYAWTPMGDLGAAHWFSFALIF